MVQRYSRPMRAQRTADAAAHPGTKAASLSLEGRRSQAEALALETRWSFLERLAARLSDSRSDAPSLLPSREQPRRRVRGKT